MVPAHRAGALLTSAWPRRWPRCRSSTTPAFGRLEDVIVYLDARFPLNEMPDDAKALMHLMQSLVMVSFPIEVWKQPRVLDSGATYIELSRSRWF